MNIFRLLIVATIGAFFTFAAGCANSTESTQTIRQYQFVGSGEGYEIALREVARPVAGAHEVLLRVRATSLNSRDLSILANNYGTNNNSIGSIPLSDGAGEIIAIGKNVSRFKVGDRVAGTFFSQWVNGKRTDAILGSARGDATDGMLSEIIAVNEQSLVTIPAHLSYEEAATLPCAAVTAWNGLFTQGNLQSGDYVLLEGTGGVSTFGLLFAAAAGAKPIITSSSNDKLASARKLGAVGTVNYRENQDWDVKVRELTGGAGVDHVLEVGGAKTLGQAVKTLGYDSHIAIIGRLTGQGTGIPVNALVRRGASATGIYVGSRENFEAMNVFMSKHKIHPVIDRVFSFEEAPEAIKFMQTGNYMGKIVIKL